MNPSVATKSYGRCSDYFSGGSDLERAVGMPISLSKVGESGVITRISGREETKRYLAGLGFTAGTRVTVVCLSNGSVVLDVKGSKIAIDGKMASKIMFYPE